MALPHRAFEVEGTISWSEVDFSSSRSKALVPQVSVPESPGLREELLLGLRLLPRRRGRSHGRHRHPEPVHALLGETGEPQHQSPLQGEETSHADVRGRYVLHRVRVIERSLLSPSSLLFLPSLTSLPSPFHLPSLLLFLSPLLSFAHLFPSHQLCMNASRGGVGL